MSFVLQGWCCECGGVVEKERREIEGERLTFRGSEWTDLSGRKVRTDCALIVLVTMVGRSVAREGLSLGGEEKGQAIARGSKGCGSSEAECVIGLVWD